MMTKGQKGILFATHAVVAEVFGKILSGMPQSQAEKEIEDIKRHLFTKLDSYPLLVKPDADEETLRHCQESLEVLLNGCLKRAHELHEASDHP